MMITADHCKLYALSDEKEFSSAFPHIHESSCDRCDNCKDVLRDLRNILDDQSIFDRFVYNENNRILQNFLNHIIHAIKSMQKHRLMFVIDNEVGKDKCQKSFLIIPLFIILFVLLFCLFVNITTFLL